ncbi:energy-coupling factor ABC transporter ATP-binding protein [Alkalibacterium sp. 20]|uniref:energy-coupling factor ABC transporter ATP-binding protein n=1 Tax=Alkalibacterium sp. 20 TaxID=1798803 RepID=UPI0008FFF4F5|nr:ABC transporter ATP-binding protein [Alkalibacterium sp. 20]OJF92911.1 cobalt ABC transporter ATP-binding protein [Alkalibacterium sp. 20]
MNRFKLKDIAFSYSPDVSIFEGLDLTFDSQTTAIVGQNGAGKTTLVKIMKGLLKPSKGTLSIDGESIADQTAAQLAKRVGLVFQNPNDQIFKTNVLEEVMFGPLNIGFSRFEAEKGAREALKKVGLESKVSDNPYDLSLSERKLIALASILAMDTEMVIFDEPTTGQDFAGKEKIKAIINELKAEGKLILCILHDMDFAADVFERTVVLNQGEVILDGQTRDVFPEKNVLEKAYLEQPYVTQIAQALGYNDSFIHESELVAFLNNKK